MPSSNDTQSGDRFLIQISSWDWALQVGMAPESMPKEHRFQGGLLYSRSLDIDGKILAPESHRGRAIRLSFMGFGPDIEFGPEGLQELGQLHEGRNESRGPDFVATAILPQDALPTCATCLASVWGFLHLWTDGNPAERAAITDFAFSRLVHKRAYPGLPDTGGEFIEGD